MQLFPLGIDISKAKFDVALLRDEGKLRHKVFPNTEAGFQQLSVWLVKHKVEAVHACMEATGTYGEALAAYLHSARHLVSVVNPAIIKAFASTEMSRTKTDKRDATQVAAFAGLVPRHNQSGTSVRGKPRICKIGAARLRKALYFPAIVATQHNPAIKAMSQRLRERGKCPMQIIGAAMRKLIHIAYGVLKSGKPFDPHYGKTA